MLHDLIEHVDAVHVSVAFSVLHGVAQEPQWVESVAVLTQASFAPPSGGHSVGVPASGHDPPQLVPSHVDFPFVGMGHTPQELVPHELVDVLERHVAAAPVPQLWVPAGQTQFPPLQTFPPVHALPHTPQLFSLTERS